ncbi:MAG: hypothetical protein H6621_00485 [Halobacteriovoraceae bacterium]|nr:hypothetical protein [Halobacteriovoraceae bacterium]
MKILSLLTLLYSSLSLCHAATIAFFQIYSYNGELLSFEKNGRFAHVALQYGDGWIHSSPKNGVEYIENFKDIGFLHFEVEIVDNPSILIDESLLLDFLGKPYDYQFLWDDNEIYCSELVAKVLNFEPSPMEFAAPYWKDQHIEIEGELGISPDEIYDELTN